jgi:hypothetical protein
VKDRIGGQRGGSECKVKNSAYIPIATLRVTHEQVEAHTNLSRDLRNKAWKARKQSGSKHERTQQQRKRLRPTGLTSTSDRFTLSLTEPHRVTREQVTGSTYPLRVTRHKGPDHPGQPRKLPVNSPQTFDQWISQTTQSLEAKFWGDDEHPEERLCPQKLRTQTSYNSRNRKSLPRALWPRFIQKSTNRRPNPAFEGPWSSTNRHKALTWLQHTWCPRFRHGTFGYGITPHQNKRDKVWVWSFHAKAR